VKCAEILLPDFIPSGYVPGAFVANIATMIFFQSKCSLPVQFNIGMNILILNDVVFYQ
jgi:hypothetical protein